MAELNAGAMSSSAKGKKAPAVRLPRMVARIKNLKGRLEGDVSDKQRDSLKRRIKSLELELAWEAATNARLAHAQKVKPVLPESDDE